MNILATQYSLKAGSLEIYLAGCKGPHCPDCHNPESHDFSQGKYWVDSWDSLKEKTILAGKLVDRIYIVGGEPLDQCHEELEKLILECHKLNKEVWLFTGREELWMVPHDIRIQCDYIKLGAYDAEKLIDDNYQHGVKLASSNQRILKRGNDY